MGQATGGLLISAVICEEKQGRTGNPVSSWAQKTLEPSSTSSASITHRETILYLYLAAQATYYVRNSEVKG